MLIKHLYLKCCQSHSLYSELNGETCSDAAFFKYNTTSICVEMEFSATMLVSCITNLASDTVDHTETKKKKLQRQNNYFF